MSIRMRVYLTVVPVFLLMGASFAAVSFYARTTEVQWGIEEEAQMLALGGAAFHEQAYTLSADTFPGTSSSVVFKTLERLQGMKSLLAIVTIGLNGEVLGRWERPGVVFELSPEHMKDLARPRERPRSFIPAGRSAIGAVATLHSPEGEPVGALGVLIAPDALQAAIAASMRDALLIIGGFGLLGLFAGYLSSRRLLADCAQLTASTLSAPSLVGDSDAAGCRLLETELVRSAVNEIHARRESHSGSTNRVGRTASTLGPVRTRRVGRAVVSYVAREFVAEPDVSISWVTGAGASGIVVLWKPQSGISNEECMSAGQSPSEWLEGCWERTGSSGALLIVAQGEEESVAVIEAGAIDGELFEDERGITLLVARSVPSIVPRAVHELFHKESASDTVQRLIRAVKADDLIAAVTVRWQMPHEDTSLEHAREVPYL